MPEPPDLSQLQGDDYLAGQQTASVDAMQPTVLRPIWREGTDHDPVFMVRRDGLRNLPSTDIHALVPRERIEGTRAVSVSRGSMVLGSQGLPVRDAGFSWTSLDHAPSRSEALRNPGSIGRARPDATSLGLGLPLAGKDSEDFRYSLGGDVLDFEPRYGGMLGRWVPSAIGSNVVNLHKFTRGIQVGMRFAALDNGEFRKFEWRQGGNAFTEEPNDNLWTGGWLRRIKQDGDQLEVAFNPCEYDTLGKHSVPGLEGGVIGAEAGDAVLWLDFEMRMRLEANYGGLTNVWRVTIEVDMPESIQTAFFPTELYLSGCFDADMFSHLIGYDSPSSTQTVISSGSTGVDGYQQDYRVYACNRARVSGDDEPSDSASPIPSGKGGVAVADGATDSDLAIMFVDDVSQDDLAETSKSLRESKGTGWRWWQNRGESSGSSGSGTIAVACGSFLTGHLHPILSSHSIEEGLISKSFLVMADTLGNCKGYADTLLP